MSRPKLLKIRLIYSVEGSQIPLEIDVDPCRTTSLFFDEQAAVDILGAFYDDKGKTITEVADAWAPYLTMAEGIRIVAKAFTTVLLGGVEREAAQRLVASELLGVETKKPRRGGSARMDPRADPNGLPMMICKDPTCLPTGYP